jgi:hypothetical protein
MSDSSNTGSMLNPLNWFKWLFTGLRQPVTPGTGKVPLSPTPEDDLKTFKQEIRDARELLDFAIANGRSVDDDIIAGIQNAEDLLTATAMPSPDLRTKFEKVYRDLARFMAPVTVETLHATSDLYGSTFLWFFRIPLSEAKRFSENLFAYAILTLIFIIVAENSGNSGLRHFFPAYEQSPQWLRILYLIVNILKTIKPSLYGLLGALSYLIRSAHDYNNNHSFDLNRKPEYYNRILLGLIAGSIAFLFIDPNSGTTKFGPDALAFLVGYNTDNLFSLIERLGTTIVPNVPAASAGGLATAAKLSLPIDVYGGSPTPVSGTIILSDVAPAAGVVVSFKSTGGAPTPADVTVPSGQKEAPVKFTTEKPTTTQAGTITASANGTTATAPFTVHVPLTATGVSSSTPIAKGTNQMKLQLSEKVPFDTTSVSLTTKVPDWKIPAQLKIDKGSDSAAFTLEADTSTAGSITATVNDSEPQEIAPKVMP